MIQIATRCMPVEPHCPKCGSTPLEVFTRGANTYHIECPRVECKLRTDKMASKKKAHALWAKLVEATQQELTQVQ